MNALDDIADEYILLSHRLGKHHEGLVDAHDGRASELKTLVNAEPVCPLDALRADAEHLLSVLHDDISERACYLRRQILALKTSCREKTASECFLSR